jgi:hypothetical protein
MSEESTMKVQFHDVGEFLTELEKDREHVDRAIVRVTCLHTSHAELPIIYVSVVATANISGYVIRLDKRAGNYMHHAQTDREEVRQRADQIAGALQNKLESLGLEIRTGILEP